MSQTCQRLHYPSSEDRIKLELLGPNGLQKVFDTEFFSIHGDHYINLDGSVYRGDQVNYFAQGMYDRAQGNIPYVRVYGWKRSRWGLWPDEETLYWYDEGRRQYGTKCRCP